MLFNVPVRCMECNSDDLTVADEATNVNSIVGCRACGLPVGRYEDILKFTVDFAASTTKQKSNTALDVGRGTASNWISGGHSH